MARRKAASEITLSEAERSTLERLVRRRKVSRGDAQRAAIVLRAAEGKNNCEIADIVGVTRQTVYNWFFGKDIFPAYRDRAEWLLKILQSSHNADDAWRKVCKELNLEL